MKKFLLILAYEYKRHVLQKRFIFAILSMPLMIAFLVGVGYLSVRMGYNKLPVGYVDPYGILKNPVQVPPDSSSMPVVASIQFNSESTAKTALDAGQIQAYYIISQNYMNSGEATRVSGENAGDNANKDFGDFLRYNLVAGLPQADAKRLTDGNNLIVRSLDGTRQMNTNNWISTLLPLVSGLLFIIAVNITGGYLLQAVVEEKENRTMEIIVTSVSPTQLMAGKITGDLLVGLTELFVWIMFAVIGLRIAPTFLPIDQSIIIEPGFLILLALTFLPAFISTAGFMGAVGSMTTEMREAQQFAGMFSLPMIVPFWFVTSIMFNPNGPLAVGMSLFPLTAPIALPMRAGFTTLPVWQVAISISLLWILAIFSLWFAGRVFRLGMLQYGKRLSFRDAFKRG